jgi:hypothetical protein
MAYHHPGLPSGHFPRYFLTKTLYAFLCFLHSGPVSDPSWPPGFHHPNDTALGDINKSVSYVILQIEFMKRTYCLLGYNSM